MGGLCAVCCWRFISSVTLPQVLNSIVLSCYIGVFVMVVNNLNIGGVNTQNNFTLPIGKQFTAKVG
jgi:hypothetical protein